MAYHPAAHEKPPDRIKQVYKVYQKINGKDLGCRPILIEPFHEGPSSGPLQTTSSTSVDLPEELHQIFVDFLQDRHLEDIKMSIESPAHSVHGRIFQIDSLPGELHYQSLYQSFPLRQVGLYIYPSLLPRETQLHLLNKLLHRDLARSNHNTNLHLHYKIPYPHANDSQATPSFFDPNSSSSIFEPIDPGIHKALTTRQVLNKKLRWMTLGGQYDWTNKVYPSSEPPPFPADIKDLIERLFPMKAEAAIVNLYSPGDTLSLHRDVSEQCDQPLVSISLGCDGIFVVGLDQADGEGESRVAVLRLRSGDAVLMSGESRYAWHGIPKVLEGTCPSWMEDWPYMGSSRENGESRERFEEWRGWMKGKRINLNVRQMFD